MSDKRKLAQQIFGKQASAYVNSVSHAQGDSLYRLIEIVNPQAGWLVLDIATGGGHVALACARKGASVIASDLTMPMLQAARQNISEKHPLSLSYLQSDAEALPIAASRLDAVMCRIAPHHFNNVQDFVTESERVLKPYGYLGVVDNISPEDEAVASYLNRLETLRDPSHVWAHSLSAWRRFLYLAGFELVHSERVKSTQRLSDWIQRSGCDEATTEKIHRMILDAPAAVREWSEISELSPSIDKEMKITIQGALFVARKVKYRKSSND